MHIVHISPFVELLWTHSLERWVYDGISRILKVTASSVMMNTDCIVGFWSWIQWWDGSPLLSHHGFLRVFHKTPSAFRRICRDTLLWHNPLLLSHALGSCRFACDYWIHRLWLLPLQWVIVGRSGWRHVHHNKLQRVLVRTGLIMSSEPFHGCTRDKHKHALFTWGAAWVSSLQHGARLYRCSSPTVLAVTPVCCRGTQSMQPCSAVPLFGAVILCLLPVVI